MRIIYRLLAVMVLLFYVAMQSSCNETSSGKQQANTDTTAVLSDKSIYNLQDTFLTQDNQPLVLASFRGKPLVMSMIFTSCQYACPKMTASIKYIEDSLSIAERDKARYVLVSFDTELDTPDKLKKFATEKGLDDNWILLHGSEDAVKNLSVLLDIKYEKLGQGAFDHSNKKIVLNKKGEIVYTEDGLNNPGENIIQALKKEL